MSLTTIQENQVSRDVLHDIINVCKIMGVNYFELGKTEKETLVCIFQLGMEWSEKVRKGEYEI